METLTPTVTAIGGALFLSAFFSAMTTIVLGYVGLILFWRDKCQNHGDWLRRRGH